MSLSMAAGTMITLCALRPVKFKAFEEHGYQQVIELSNAYFMPQQQHNLAAVRLMTYGPVDVWNLLTSEGAPGMPGKGLFPRSHTRNNEFVWHVQRISDLGEETIDGVVVPRSLAATRPRTVDLVVRDPSVETVVSILRPLGH